MAGISKENWPEWHFMGLFLPIPSNKHAGTGMGITVCFEPKDVSFANAILGEGYASGMLNGKLEEHPKNIWSMPGGDVERGTIAKDGVGTSQDPIDTPSGTLVWNIEFGYYDLGTCPSPIKTDNPLIPIAVNPQIYIYDGRGTCTVTKFGMKATRGPKNVLNLLKSIRDNKDYTDGWEFKD